MKGVPSPATRLRCEGGRARGDRPRPDRRGDPPPVRGGRENPRWPRQAVGRPHAFRIPSKCWSIVRC